VCILKKPLIERHVIGAVCHELDAVVDHQSLRLSPLAFGRVVDHRKRELRDLTSSFERLELRVLVAVTRNRTRGRGLLHRGPIVIDSIIMCGGWPIGRSFRSSLAIVGRRDDKEHTYV